jgi:AbiV family abortive infection protein
MAFVQYKGPLDAQKATLGMNYSIKNANRLLKDSKRLFEINSYASALSLAVLAIEEIGKISIIREIEVASTELQLKKAWKRYRSHLSKNNEWIFNDLVNIGARKLEDFRKMFSGYSNHPIFAEHIKQLAIYTDCLNNGDWVIPEIAIDEFICKKMIEAAEAIMINREIAIEENTIWIKHFYGKDLGNIEEAKIELEKYFKEIIEKGLSSVELNSVKKFLF